MADEVNFFRAFETALSPVLETQALSGLLLGLHRSGALATLLEPVTAAALPEVLGMTAPVAAATAEALTLHGVLETTDSGTVVTPVWRALIDDSAFSDLGDTLRLGSIMGRLLEGAGRGDYWTMPSEDRIILARAISPNPYADGLVAAFRADIEADPDRADLVTGAHMLELGCGLAGRILTTLRAAPGLTAVGVEVSPDLAAEASRRAADLGLADRLTIVCEDAATFTTDTEFDRAFWSQFFFPEDTRAAALATMFAAVRSGGVVVSPLVDDEPSDALFRVMLTTWGVPLRTGAELQEEYVAAGFVDVELAGGEGGRPRRVQARRP